MPSHVSDILIHVNRNYMITKNQQKIKKKPYPTIQHTLYEEQKRGKLFDIDYIV